MVGTGAGVVGGGCVGAVVGGGNSGSGTGSTVVEAASELVVEGSVTAAAAVVSSTTGDTLGTRPSPRLMAVKRGRLGPHTPRMSSRPTAQTMAPPSPRDLTYSIFSRTNGTVS